MTFCGRQLAVIAIATWATCAAAFSQETPPRTVELKPRWKAGDEVRFEFAKAKRQKQAGVAVGLQGGARTIVDMKVISVDENGSVVRWRQGETTLDDESILDRVPSTRHLINMSKGVEYDIEVDAGGQPTGVRNWEQVRRQSLEILAAMKTNLLDKSEMAPAQVDAVCKQAESMLNDRTRIEAMFLADAGLWFMFLGRTYTTGEPLEFESQNINAFGGEPFPAVETFMLQSAADPSGHAVLRWRKDVDQEKMAESMKKSMVELAKQVGKPIPEGYEFPKMSIEQTAEAQIDPRIGWPQRLLRKTTTAVGIQVSEETIDIKRLSR
jgi:hypothetical protein